MAEQSEPVSEIPPSPPHAWARATMWIAIVLILTLAGVYIFKSLRDLPGEAVDKTTDVIRETGRSLAGVAAAFHQGTITTSFISYATTVSASQYLQFATVKQMEVFTQKDEATTAFGYLPLPEIIVEARAPVEYTYYLDLNSEWKMTAQNGVLHVLAPRIKFNKPAVDVSAIGFEVRKDSVFRNKDEAMENLKKSITVMVHSKARQNVSLVRETGRKQTADFVEKWLTRQFPDGNQYAVKVYFPDESLPVEADFPIMSPEKP